MDPLLDFPGSRTRLKSLDRFNLRAREAVERFQVSEPSQRRNSKEWASNNSG